jgi:hypothetical protein
MVSVFVVLCVFSISLSGCGEVKKARVAIDGMFNSYQNADFSNIQNYVDFGSSLDNFKKNFSDSDIKMFEDKNVLTKLALITSQTDYDITKIEKADANTVNATLKISAVDASPLVSDFLQQYIAFAFTTAFSGAASQESSDDLDAKMENQAGIIIEGIASEQNLQKISNTIDITVKKANGTWKVEGSDDLIDDVTGGFLTAINNFSGQN